MKSTILILLFISYSLFSQTTYIWTGNVSSSFGAAGNWAPSRPIMYPTDILILEKGGTINITNVNQITVGQLIIRNNTFVRMTPSSGNPRILSIQGIPGLLKKGQENKVYYIGDLKYKEYSGSENMGQDIDAATSKYNEYKIPDGKGMGDVKLADKEINVISERKGLGDLKYSEHELFSFTDGDLVIDTGSSLEISANDPKLSIFIRQNANAVISGSLIFSGTQENSFNSNDSNAIEFKKGSLLIQSCPGYIFTNGGSNNSVLFESGSAFNIENAQASNPFGLPLPNSKVRFEKGSTLNISVSQQNLRFKGRKLPNLNIKNNSEVIVIDSATRFSVDSISIAANSSLIMFSSNNVVPPAINIEGNLNINGTLIFADSSRSLPVINFDGNSLQNICGTGDIIFPAIGEVEVSNNIKLYRNLVIPCTINEISGTIDYNGFSIFTSGYSGKSEAIRSKSENSGAKIESNIPIVFSLSQNYPNPFNPVTKIDYSLPKNSHVELVVYDMSGKVVKEIVNGNETQGNHTISFVGSDLASGVYIYKIMTNGFTDVKKMVLLK